jgi:hypothetical protein
MNLEHSPSVQSSENHVTRTVQPIRRKVAELSVQEAAYFIWEKEGHINGRALDHWLRAENHVRRLVDVGKFHGQGE